MFGQTLFARLATERFVRQTRCWTRMFDRLAGALLDFFARHWQEAGRKWPHVRMS